MFFKHESGGVYQGNTKENNTDIELTESEIIDYINPTLSGEALINAIKSKAGELILARMPEWKQRNYLARRLELSEIATPTQADLDEMAFIDGEWAYAKSIRTISDTAEANLTPLNEIVWQ